MINFIILGAILGLSKGSGVLPDGPLNASVGGTVLFGTTLNSTEDPFLSVIWTFGDGVASIITSLSDRNVTAPEYEGRITLFRSNGSLQLRDLKLSDGGVYQVNILTAAGTQEIGKTSLQIYEPVIVEVNPSSANVTEFSSISFFCSSSGSDLSFLWLNGSSEITASDRVQINTTNGGSYMTIVNVTRYDQGTYWCHVSSPVSFNNDSASLVVSYGPQNTQLEVYPVQDYYNEESAVTLNCTAESVPPAEFSWFQNGAILPDTGPKLTFNKIQMNHNGSYTCRAYNSKTLRYQISQPLIINVKENIDSSGLSAGAIAGIVIACLTVVAAAAGGGYYIYRKKEKNDIE